MESRSPHSASGSVPSESHNDDVGDSAKSTPEGSAAVSESAKEQSNSEKKEELTTRTEISEMKSEADKMPITTALPQQTKDSSSTGERFHEIAATKRTNVFSARLPELTVIDCVRNKQKTEVVFLSFCSVRNQYFYKKSCSSVFRQNLYF